MVADLQRQRNRGALGGDVRPGSHRDPDVRSGESRCVVGAITGHRDDVAGGALFLHRAMLVLR